MDYRGRRATIVGLGHFGGGAGAARWLARQGAIVTVTDSADHNALADLLPLLADVPITAIHLGGHRQEDFAGADLVVVNPALRPGSPWLNVARQSGARLCTELELFMENCPARIVGVTGSNGKSTTAAMIASILDGFFMDGPESSPLPTNLRSVPGEGTRQRRTFLGGNIGGSLLEQLPQIGLDDWVVLEISSFQLWHFTPAARMPHVAVVTGCSPNHLDWHGSYADYVAAKQRILTGQRPDDFAVLNPFDAEAASWSSLVRGKQVVISRTGVPACPKARATACRPISLADLPPLPVPGEHNRINAGCAAAAATAAGCNVEEIERGLAQFRPLPQRLERFGELQGRWFYDDSAATTPESTIAALRSLAMPVWLLAGGRGKGADLAPLAAEIVRSARGAAFFGSLADELHLLTTAHDPQFSCLAVETMEEALQWCWSQSRSGDAIVLSPGCASTDQYRNYRQRGQRFVELVEGLLTGNETVL